jgi:Tfp pilus assembly protein PilF
LLAGIDLVTDKVDSLRLTYQPSPVLDPRSASAFVGRGRAYRVKGDLSRAMADYDDAIRLDPKNAEIFNNRGVAMIYMQDYGRAIEKLD